MSFFSTMESVRTERRLNCRQSRLCFERVHLHLRWHAMISHGGAHAVLAVVRALLRQRNLQLGGPFRTIDESRSGVISTTAHHASERFGTPSLSRASVRRRLFFVGALCCWNVVEIVIETIVRDSPSDRH
jgi:hypothetical protein